MCLSDTTRGTQRGTSSRDETRRKERKGSYTSKRVARPLSRCRWLNFARIPRTKIAIRAGATSEFFMPASRGHGRKTQLPLAAVYFLCTFYFCFPPLNLSFTSFFPSTTFRPLFIPSASSGFSALGYDHAVLCRPLLSPTKLEHRRQRKFNLERSRRKNGGEPARTIEMQK